MIRYPKPGEKNPLDRCSKPDNNKGGLLKALIDLLTKKK